MQTILIAGGTGFVGKHLVSLLVRQGYGVHILSRKKTAGEGNSDATRFFYWNPETGEYDPHAFEGVEALVNLSGTGVADKRWTAAYKKEIITSRTDSIQLLAKAIKETPNNIQSVISASATGWYGADTEASINKGGFTEDDPPADSFFGETCKQWEDAARLFAETDKRLVVLRIGIVMHPDGGMMKELLKPLRFGIAPVLGKPGRMISWIQMQDLCRMIQFAVENKQLNGVFNAVNINPISNGKLVTEVAKSKNRFFIKMPVPTFLLKIMVGEFSTELLNSVSVSGNKIAAAGFTFRLSNIADAVVAS
jgi:uncharacterized protein